MRPCHLYWSLSTINVTEIWPYFQVNMWRVERTLILITLNKLSVTKGNFPVTKSSNFPSECVEEVNTAFLKNKHIKGFSVIWGKEYNFGNKIREKKPGSPLVLAGGFGELWSESPVCALLFSSASVSLGAVQEHPWHSIVNPSSLSGEQGPTQGHPPCHLWGSVPPDFDGRIWHRIQQVRTNSMFETK